MTSPNYKGPKDEKSIEMDPEWDEQEQTPEEQAWLDGFGTQVLHLPPIDYSATKTGDNTHS